MGEKRPLLKTAGTKRLWVAFWEERDSRAFSGSSSNSRGGIISAPRIVQNLQGSGGMGMGGYCSFSISSPCSSHYTIGGHVDEKKTMFFMKDRIRGTSKLEGAIASDSAENCVSRKSRSDHHLAPSSSTWPVIITTATVPPDPTS